MPTYEYECQKCGHSFERFQKITERPVQKCPECRGKVKRLLGAGSGIIFKGSGFYQTDYRSESYRKAAKAESGEQKAASAPEKAATKATGTDQKG